MSRVVWVLVVVFVAAAGLYFVYISQQGRGAAGTSTSATTTPQHAGTPTPTQTPTSPNAHDRPDAGAADHDSRKSDGYVDVADRNSGSDRYVDVYCPTARRLVAPVRGQEPRG